MIKTIAKLTILLGALLVAGCEDNDCVFCDSDDVIILDPAPQPPQGVYSITGDDTVYVYWNGPYEEDIKEYIIWRSYEEYDNYVAVGYRQAEHNPNLDLIIYEFKDDSVTNGVTYFYAVTAVDDADQMSELSAESVFDTPRPDGRAVFYDRAARPNQAGFSFSPATVVPYPSSAAHVYVDRGDNGVFYINAANIDVEIQGMGFTYGFDDIGWAPQEGWSANGWAEIVPGHSYVVGIRDNHGDWNYAKIRILATDEQTGEVSFQWAYQPSPNNPELVAPPEIGNKDTHEPEADAQDM